MGVVAGGYPRKTHTMILLTDTFNKTTISRHRTIEAAVRAKDRHARRVEQANGKGSHVWYAITSEDGADIRDEVMAAQESLNR